MVRIRIPLVPHKYELVYVHNSSMKCGIIIFFSYREGKMGEGKIKLIAQHHKDHL